MKIYMIFGTFLAILLSGCLAKSAPAQETYSLKYNAIKNQEVCIQRLKSSVFVRADSNDDNKFIFVKNGDRLTRLAGAKFDLFYTDMLVKMMIGALGKSCEFSPSGARIASDMQLDLRVLEFYADDEKANISLLFTLTKAGSVIKTGVINSANKSDDKSAKSLVKAFNEAANDSVNKVLLEISKAQNI
ncbi:hypothetical protein [Campylobacter sp. 19-13652]|uniref:hypothetical protein n=1 Tax=Campylobacter sp. 19-13652 TaxID=2840180 RepID=UPI001C749F27|nr:hypothetical protein [Campylobacter sp. 19-13652]BCX78983.1 hypothetical protein LBC_04450 [Campylobacter sp. 19-13652]